MFGRLNDEQLNDYLKSAILENPGKLVICAGHFLLVHNPDDGRLVPAIVEETENKKLKENIEVIYDRFPSYTFDYGVNLLKFARENSKEAHLTVLINDWQKVKKDPDREDSEPNIYRERFFEDNKKPPNIYRDILINNGFNEDENIWVGEKEGKYFFAETRLRDQFSRNVKKLSNPSFYMKDCRIGECSDDKHRVLKDKEYPSNDQDFGPKFIKEKDGENTKYYFQYDEYTRVKVAKNGKADCCGEITQMVKLIADITDSHLLINFLPIECQLPVDEGVNIAFSYYGLDKLEVINIFPLRNRVDGGFGGQFIMSTFNKDS